MTLAFPVTEPLISRCLIISFDLLQKRSSLPTPQALSKAWSSTGVPAGLPSRNLTAAIL